MQQLGKRWERSFHEQEAVRDAKAAERLIKFFYADCDAQAAGSLIKANRAIAHARTHLVSIGSKDSKRTKQLWRFVGGIDRKLQEANNRFKRCLLKD